MYLPRSATSTAAILFLPQYILASTLSELEHLLVDTSGLNNAGFKDAITPCTHYVSGSQLSGRETAAQWLRVAFHDFVTADVSSGIGGLDASIGFETLREENSGAAMNDSLSFFAPYVNHFVSMADLIALSVVMSTTACSSATNTLNIPLRGGRIDAQGPGATGVPAPETSLDDTLTRFSGAGFGKEDAIALTACGHTMGSIHHGGFPQVVPASFVTVNNTNGGAPFDATPGVFDVNVVNEYLTNTGSRGGMLVTTENVTVRSDLRLYTSDGNATMQQLASSSEYFAAQCESLLSRMIDTVPARVVLTEPVKPMQWKLVNTTLDLDTTGALSVKGFIRNLHSVTETAMPSVDYIYTDRRQEQHESPSFVASYSGAGRSLFGDTAYYAFSNPVNGSGIDSLNFGNATFSISDKLFVVPSMSSFNSDTSEANITVAVLGPHDESGNVTAAFFAPTAQQGTLAPRIETTNVPLGHSGAVGSYELFRGRAKLEQVEGVVLQIFCDDGRSSEAKKLVEVLS